MTPISTNKKWLFSAIALIAVAGAALFVHLHDDPSHHHDSHKNSSQLVLNEGKKWATDEALRTGMKRLRDLTATMSERRSEQGIAPEQAIQLKAGVQEQIGFLIRHCKLEPNADAVLHVLIGDLLSGAEMIANPATATQGLDRILKALNQYPQYFDHADWIPIESAA